MKFVALALTAFVALASAQATNGPNAFNVPPSGFAVVADQPTTFTWTPGSSGTVTLTLRQGNSGTLDAGTVLASGVSNTGSYTYTPPTTIPAGAGYTIQITADDKSVPPNFTPQFSVANTSPNQSTASSATGTSASTSASTDSTAATSGTTTTASTGSTASTSTTVTTTAASTTATTTVSTTGTTLTTTTGTASTGFSNTTISSTNTVPSASKSVTSSSGSTAPLPTVTGAAMGLRVGQGLLALVAAGAFAVL